jgi:hypothetical protein
MANHCENATTPSVLRISGKLLRAWHTASNRLSNQCRRKGLETGSTLDSVQHNKGVGSACTLIRRPCRFTYLARKEVRCVSQISLPPLFPMYSLADQKVLPSASSTVEL